MVTVIYIPPMGHLKEFYPLKDINNCKQIVLSYPYDKSVLEVHDSLDWLANYFTKQIEDLNLDKFIMVGVSLGATLLNKIDTLLNHKSEKLIMLAPGGMKVAKVRRELIEKTIKEIPQEEFIEKALGLESANFHESGFSKHFAQIDSNIEDYFNMLYDFWRHKKQDVEGKVFCKYAIDALNVNYEELLIQNEGKIHIIWSEKDKIFSIRHFKKFQKHIPNALLELIPDSGHYLPLENNTLSNIILKYVSNI